MNGNLRDLRRKALNRIVTLSCSSNGPTYSDLEKLCKSCPGSTTFSGDFNVRPSNGLSSGIGKGAPSLSNIPITLSELDVLLSLCKAAPLLDIDCATRLLLQITPYLLEAHAQAFAPSPFLRNIEPSPWEALSSAVVTGVLSIGIRHIVLRGKVLDHTTKYLAKCLEAVNSVCAARQVHETIQTESKASETLQIATLTVSLSGFFEAAAANAEFYTIFERLELIKILRRILTEPFLVSVEGAFSSIRTAEFISREFGDWKQYSKRYALAGKPLGAMLLQRGFMKLLASFSALQVCSAALLQQADVFEVLLESPHLGCAGDDSNHLELQEILTEVAFENMRLLEDGSDYLLLGSSWQQRLASTVKAYSLTVFLHCMIADNDRADVDVLMGWLEDTMVDSIQMADENLACVVLKSLAIIAKHYPAIAPSLSHLLPRFIVQSGIQGPTVIVAARCLAYVLQLLSQDAIITGLYSLGNVLSAGSVAEMGTNVSVLPDRGLNGIKNAKRYTRHTTGSAISLGLGSDEEVSIVYSNVVRAVVQIATTCKDEKIIALAQSMLLQKLGKVSMAVDTHIISETAILATNGGHPDLESLLRLYSRFGHEGAVKSNRAVQEAVLQARMQLSANLEQDSPHFQTYLIHLLETIISKGDVRESENTHQTDMEFAALEIAQLLSPLADLLSRTSKTLIKILDDDIPRLQRDAWFNIVVHGITPSTRLGRHYTDELRRLAIKSAPLIAEDHASQHESDIELNTILRRGMSGSHVVEQKQRLIELLPRCESDIKALSYPKVIYLSAAYLVETLRAEMGSCADVIIYFADRSVHSSEMASCMAAIADVVLGIYLRRVLSGSHANSASPLVAEQLALLLAGCCHRIFKVQQIAVACADKIISHIPSSLCQESSLFALLELLTLMWASCLEADTDEYEWKSRFSSPRGKVSVELSDDYEFRRKTLSTFYARAKTWVIAAINIAPLDVKGLLQTYLSEYDDDGAYGHVSLGRSFALEMGLKIPSTDRRLGAIDRRGEEIFNTASDFIAQYTTRQEYRYADTLRSYDQDSAQSFNLGERTSSKPSVRDDFREAEAMLSHVECRTFKGTFVSIDELRDVLRRAAALLCKARNDQCSIVHYLVGIPFTVFTKQSINLGISLWLGVINENPRMESRIFTEIAENWERTVSYRLGVFDSKLHHLDPFYVKEEFAPSNKTILLKRQQAVHDLIAPHLRILQFLTSHFNATRLASVHIWHIFLRLIRVTLKGLQRSSGHPLAREAHFTIIIFGLNVLRHCPNLEQAAQWRLKDLILSAALTWFCFPPRWSFGGNRLQIKTETRLLADVESALRSVASIGFKVFESLHSLAIKQDLLSLLLNDEHMRLTVWLYPLESERRHFYSLNHAEKPPPETQLSKYLNIAWEHQCGLALQLVARFPSMKLNNEVRSALLVSPEEAIAEADALQYLVGSKLPFDLSYQLKYLLYWAPVNPVAAVTYFLPAFRDHPFILQYAMRALESHSVDVTFFYVPQIVQTLRYDVLGYVERYIVETAKFSQLFAHQIIWNMKANAYKDEDSTIEDPVKPTLDKVLKNMISSFSRTDKAFYEREFAFFNEITDISGKLRPFIRRSKPEKKQKIEEELRKIKVDVGVYLPSNPDGVVVGIDRKSGKPLQSHAKAPYLATFRIKKNKGEMEGTDDMLEKTNQNYEMDRDAPVTSESTYEVWQSAIFKVGDDCRQDILALQMIAAFRGIFNNVGLDVFVYPYRVTATAPGCGVIDVLPNSISRDMLGREAVNGLYEYFVSRYGGEDSIKFQEVRNNFVKSMAAYSVISYLLQFKDRHNGNIMVDDAGHILHIDFGFCFDIAPGGVRFERAPFKLTTEMVAVMGGSTTSQSYKWFEELCIRSFLASRPYAEKLCHMVILMLDSGLPCFKPETISHFRERFVLEKSEREAADFMKELIRKSHNSYSTKGYDQFQLLTNGIPY